MTPDMSGFNAQEMSEEAFIKQSLLAILLSAPAQLYSYSHSGGGDDASGSCQVSF